MTATKDNTFAIGGITFSDYGPDYRVSIHVDNGETGGDVPVPYLSGHRLDDGSVFLTLDSRLGLDLPAAIPVHVQDAIVEFVANAIAVGAGYPSIYYTDRKLPFRG